MNDKIYSINFEKIFSDIRLSWFYKKPVLFKLLCLYELKAVYGINCLFRTNGKIIEYNPEIAAEKNLASVKESLELELCRIMLRHPYRKKPQNTDEDEWYKASTITITQKSLAKYNLPAEKNIEFYYMQLMKQKLLDNVESQGGGNKQGTENKDKNEEVENDSGSNQKDNNDDNSELIEETKNNDNKEADYEDKKLSNDSPAEELKGPTAYWGQNELEDKSIQDFVKQNLTSELWGNLPGDFEALLKASVEDFEYYKKVLQFFKNSTGNGNRTLTRMKPNRRSGFLQMGNRYKNVPSKILIAIDTSESVGDQYLKKFYGAIKSIYFKGIKNIDVIQFDMRVLSEKPERFTKKAFYKIKGRGGTSFQCVFNYVQKHHLKYDGLIIFTDGFASCPIFNKRKNIKVLWMLTKKSGEKKWMKETGITGWF